MDDSMTTRPFPRRVVGSMRGMLTATVVAAILALRVDARVDDVTTPSAAASPPAAPVPTELASIHLHLSMPRGIEAREASVWVLTKGKPILAVFNADGEAVVEVPKDEADASRLYVSVARPWTLIDREDRGAAAHEDDLDDLMIRFEQYVSYYPPEVLGRLESIRSRSSVAALDIKRDEAGRRVEVQMLRAVEMHGQVDHPGLHPRWYPRWWSMPGVSYAPRIGESGDFRFRVPEGVDIGILAWCEGCRLVEVNLSAWRRGDRGVHIRLPTTPASDLVDGPNLGFRDARIDRRTGELQPLIEGLHSYCRSLTFVSPDGVTMYHWAWPPIRGMDDVGAESTPGGWKASDYFGQLGFLPDGVALHRLQLGIGTWWVFETGIDIGSGMADFWTCLEGIRDGFDVDGIGIPRVTVTHEPGPGQVFDAPQIRSSIRAAADWIRACRAADAEKRPRPAKPEVDAATTPKAKNETEAKSSPE
jgi:hypothetical protein